MYESEIIRLRSKVEELKKSYETVRIRRENHSLELNSLDNQIEDITKSLEELEIEKERNKRRKEIISKDTKSAFIRANVVFNTSLILRAIIDTYVTVHTYTVTEYILQVILPLLSIAITMNILPILILRIIYYVNSK